ncbi:hypothetical protein P170DRAFT_460790 [Aspergillus steynii IBT 23096]|uniref:SMP-30/Gluconolactonase/LRE-like region domain-containing protein n=1 Tax=Aspergillus steynii IBT 23096 TaxID=1392250 RepID=A0A2I2GPD7_9EURO|nr:uncharacterized protein P170DRAFT_460790 [Aspergillus steynii IBT 23096]PLB54744.1 hypothetical protein P170DRAFT_460790 [Aspergillus steynii IBT 23096]
MLLSLTRIVCFVWAASALNIALAQTVIQSYPLSLISRFSSPQTFENIAVKSNGHLLLTSTTSPTVFEVSPFFENRNLPLVEIPQAQGLLGIVELEEDVFYVASSNITASRGTPGSNAVWRIDLRNATARSTGGEVSLVANITDAGTLNGMCRLGQSDRMLLVADSAKGQIFSLDVANGDYKVVMNETILQRTTDGLPVAVDGIRVHDSDVFFTNFNQGLFGRIPISPSSGTPTGTPEVTVANLSGDDFLLSDDGSRAWIAMNGNSTVVEVDILNKSSKVIVQSPLLASAAAIARGRSILDRDSLYVASGGCLSLKSNGSNVSCEGIVARIDVPSPGASS